MSTPSNGSTTDDSTPNLSWSADNANYFHVQIDNNSNFSSPERENTNVGAFNWTPSSMSDGTYYWRVRSHGTDGSWSSWSSAWSFTISTTSPGSVSGGVRDAGTSAAIGGATVRLRQSGTTKYETTSASNGTYTILNVTPGTYDLVGSKSGYHDKSYSVTVNNGENVPGKNLALTPSVADPAVPTQLTPSNWQTLNSGNVSFDWSDAANATKYRLKVSRNSDLTNPFLNEYYTSSQHTENNLSNDTYYWQVGAENSVGVIKWSGIWAFVVNASQNGSVSGGVRDASNNNALGGATVRLRVYGTTKYETTSASNGTYTISNVVPGTYDLVGSKSGYQNYSYLVTVGNGEPLTGKNLTLTPNIADPAVPAQLSPSNWQTLNSGNVSFDWTDAANATKYRLKVSRNSDLTNPFVNEYYTSSQHTEYNLSNDTYYWQVGAENSVGVIKWSGIWAFVVETTQNGSVSGGVRDATTDNPIGGATVRLKQSGTTKYTVTSASNGTYTISNVTPGTYTLLGTKSGYQNKSYSVTVNNGENVTGKNLALQPVVTNGSVSGGVRDATNNNPLGGATVRLKQSGTTKYTVTSASNGTYTISNVTPGTYDLVGSKSGYNNASYSVTVGNGENLTNKNISLQKTTQTITPTVSLSQTTIKRGETFYERGSGFTPNNAVIMYFKQPDGSIVQVDIDADSDGNYDNEYTMPENASLGEYEYWAEDVSTGIEASRIPYTVIQEEGELNNPKVYVNKNEVLLGQAIIESGYHFTPNGAVVMHFKLPDQSEVQQNKNADDQGKYDHEYTFSSDAQVGTYSYWAVDITTGKRSSNTVSFAVLSNTTNNTPCRISNGKINPSSILASQTATFTLSYQDRDNDAPTLKKLQVVTPGSEDWQDIEDFQAINDNYTATTLFTCSYGFVTPGIYQARAVFNDGHTSENSFFNYGMFEVRANDDNLTTVPQVVSTVPQGGAQLENLQPNITLNYNVPMDHISFNGKIEVVGSLSGKQSYSLQKNQAHTAWYVRLTTKLVENETVTVTVKKGVKSIHGVESQSEYALILSTVATIQNDYKSIGNVEVVLVQGELEKTAVYF